MFDLTAHRRLLFLALVFALLFAPSAFAQTVTGTIQGTVTDSGGAVVPGADVAIRNLETGQERNLKTGGEGTYVAPFLPLGKYTVTVTTAGFNKVAQENIDVTLNQT
ncbi:MAG TPA: carboxypeptidase-like regulatory domain-containing protein, partial [Pyrinomonadaceae bacterium]|nr:carboxypeptidase-like regulatory domain-containing protein [Pyrinomonadaceae bacterium]